MIDTELALAAAGASANRTSWLQRAILFSAFGVNVDVYVLVAHGGYLLSSSLDPARNYDNLLVQGFQAGQLNLKTEVPEGLKELANPYNPVAHAGLPVVEAFTLSLYYHTERRYEVEFLPTLLLMAMIGILQLQRSLGVRASWRRVVPSGWLLLLAFPVGFNLLTAVARTAEWDYGLGNALPDSGELAEAIEQYEQAVRIKPDYAEAHNHLGVALMMLGRNHEAVAHYQQALRINPNFAEARKNLTQAEAQ